VFGAANQTAFEAIQSLRTVHSYNLQSRVAGIYRGLLAEPIKIGTRNALLSGASFGAGQFFMFAVYALSFWFGGKQVDSGKMDIGDVLLVFFAILLASMGVSQAQMAFPDVGASHLSSALARITIVVTALSRTL
jgi:ATP-binding cassette, subfamily B (MDR/TAP), member 1